VTYLRIAARGCGGAVFTSTSTARKFLHRISELGDALLPRAYGAQRLWPSSSYLFIAASSRMDGGAKRAHSAW